jgi:hypothetical protein
MIHGSEPSQLFLDTIHTGYHIEATGYGHDAGHREVTPAGILDQIVRMGLRKVHPFGEIFAWDTRRKPSQKRNRIADIAEAISKGYVPQLRLTRNARGGLIVLHGGEEGR